MKRKKKNIDEIRKYKSKNSPFENINTKMNKWENVPKT